MKEKKQCTVTELCDLIKSNDLSVKSVNKRNIFRFKVQIKKIKNKETL